MKIIIWFKFEDRWGYIFYIYSHFSHVSSWHSIHSFIKEIQYYLQNIGGWLEHCIHYLSMGGLISSLHWSQAWTHDLLWQMKYEGK